MLPKTNTKPTIGLTNISVKLPGYTGSRNGDEGCSKMVAILDEVEDIRIFLFPFSKTLSRLAQVPQSDVGRFGG